MARTARGREVRFSLGSLDLGNPGDVQNMLTRPAESDIIVDTIDDEHNDGLMSDAQLGQDGVMEFDSDRPFLRCGDLVELSLVG
jgi:hypothetical protein